MASDDPPPSPIRRSPSRPAPPTLAYDDLAPGSDIRREYSGAGDAREVRLTVPAAEPPPPVERGALADSFSSGARATCAVLLFALVLFWTGLQHNRVTGLPLAWAWGFFAVFCAALVLLVAWVRYRLLLDAIRLGRRQMTVLAATPARLLIETIGPFGIASHDVARAEIAAVTVCRRGVMPDDRNLPRRLPHLAIALRDGRTMPILPGRDVRELEWVRSAIRETMALGELRIDER
jgi:hypothetical protein